MAYTVQYCDQFMDELLDKMGSDYFPRPIKLRRFQSIALQFIRESTSFLEATQEISDDISSLIVSPPKYLLGGKTHKYMGKFFYKIDLPEDYLRLLNVVPYYEEKGSPIIGGDFEVKIYRIGTYLINERNPFRKANESRINVYRMDDAILLDTTYNSFPPLHYADLTYVRKPVFGNLPEEMMVDVLNDIVVDKLMHKTCVSLRATSSDSDTNLMDELTERQGQKIK